MTGSRALRGLTVVAVSSYLLLQALARLAGARPSERTMTLPGDDLVADAQVSVTRAATLPAPPSSVWPWLAQVGWGRAGWYTPRWVDRLLFPANAPSATTVRPDLQDLSVGDRVPDGPPETQCHFDVVEIAPEHHLVLRSTSHLPLSWRVRGCASVDWSWAFLLRPEHEGTRTRLVFRWRSRTSPTWLTAAVHAVVVPADWVMSRGMLRGLSRRVRASCPPGLGGTVEPASERGLP